MHSAHSQSHYSNIVTGFPSTRKWKEINKFSELCLKYSTVHVVRVVFRLFIFLLLQITRQTLANEHPNYCLCLIIDVGIVVGVFPENSVRCFAGRKNKCLSYMMLCAYVSIALSLVCTAVSVVCAQKDFQRRIVGVSNEESWLSVVCTMHTHREIYYRYIYMNRTHHDCNFWRFTEFALICVEG